MAPGLLWASCKSHLVTYAATSGMEGDARPDADGALGIVGEGRRGAVATGGEQADKWRNGDDEEAW